MFEDRGSIWFGRGDEERLFYPFGIKSKVSTVKSNVLLIVDTNYGVRRQVSDRFYTHFSLLKTIETSFGLPCLNHACDKEAELITDLFSEH
jgi:hypothetical protein